MTAEDDLVVYLQNHPEFHKFSEDPRYVGILSLLAGKGKYMADILKVYPGMSETEVLSVLEELAAGGCVAKIELAHGFLFYRREKCEAFFKLYTKARGSYNLGNS